MAERMKIPNRKKQKAGSRAKHRLRSIDRDIREMEDLVRRRHASSLETYALHHWKIIPNERCGTWYVPPVSETQVPPTIDNSGHQPHCYFKSTDGHSQVWEFSLKRLNLSLLEDCIAKDGGCLLVDSSVRKLLPDSFSKTLPIWACVWNRILLRYKNATNDVNDNNNDINNGDEKQHNNNNEWWDTSLYTPRGVVSKEEHETIASLMEDRVETLFRSGAIVNPSRLLERLTKPLRVFWMNHEGNLYASHGDPQNDGNETIFDGPNQALEEILQKYFVIVCWNPSRYRTSKNGIVPTRPQSKDELIVALEKHQTEWIREEEETDYDNDAPLETAGDGLSGYYYTPGAADDHESWAQHLTPELFWKHREALLNHELNEDEIDDLITVLVAQDETAQEQQQEQQEGIDTVEEARRAVYSYSDRIGETNLWIGSRRASRPPECWSAFDVILNVTHQEYDDMLLLHENEKEEKDRYYLQLPVQEGKRDRTQLEQWMPVGLAFLIRHVQEGRRVLVHCAQGKDRSVAVALIFVAMVCPLQFPLRFKPEFQHRLWDLSTLDSAIHSSNDSEDPPNEKEICSNTKGQLYRSSGLPEAMVQRLLQAGGKELFLLWIHGQLRRDAMNKTNNNNSNDIDIPEIPRYKCLADKEGVRIALHLIKQDREVAEPTRSTMQKIHRFLMSSSIYR